MSKKSLFLMTGLLTAILTVGCGKTSSGEETADTSQEKIITGYLVENADLYITLGNYYGLEVERPVYSVTDEEVNMEVENRIYEKYDLADTGLPSQDGDLLTLDITATIQGEEEPVISEKNYTLELGYSEFGTDVDQQLTGCSVGDHKTFSSSFDENSWYEDWIGKTLDFDITVVQIQKIVYPEYDDDFVKSAGFDSKEDFENAIRKELEENYEEQGNAEARENAISAAIENCAFNGYPDKLYDSCEEAVRDRYRSFAEAFGMSEEEFYDASGMTDDDLKEEILEDVNRRLFISALCNAEHIQITEEEYHSYLEEQAAVWSFENADALETEYGKEYLLWNIYEEKVSDYLLEQAVVTDVLVSMNDDWDFDQDYADEDYDDGDEDPDLDSDDEYDEYDSEDFDDVSDIDMEDYFDADADISYDLSEEFPETEN